MTTATSPPDTHRSFRVWWLNEDSADTIVAPHAIAAAELYAGTLGCKRVIVTTERVSRTRWVVTRVDTDAGDGVVTTYRARLAREGEEE
jgi:hypothetical protein